MDVRLSERQRQVLDGFAEGLTIAEIGQRVYLSPHTVRIYRSQLLEALGARNAAQAVHIAHQLGLLS